jgi:hypothetical protein
LPKMRGRKPLATFDLSQNGYARGANGCPRDHGWGGAGRGGRNTKPRPERWSCRFCAPRRPGEGQAQSLAPGRRGALLRRLPREPRSYRQRFSRRPAMVRRAVESTLGQRQGHATPRRSHDSCRLPVGSPPIPGTDRHVRETPPSRWLPRGPGRPHTHTHRHTRSEAGSAMRKAFRKCRWSCRSSELSVLVQARCARARLCRPPPSRICTCHVCRCSLVSPSLARRSRPPAFGPPPPGRRLCRGILCPHEHSLPSLSPPVAGPPCSRKLYRPPFTSFTWFTRTGRVNEVKTVKGGR